MENQRDLLQRIHAILYFYSPTESKYEQPAKNLLTYIKHAYNQQIEKVPDTYKEFALQMMHHFPELQEKESMEEKVKFLKTVIQGCLEVVQK